MKMHFRYCLVILLIQNIIFSLITIGQNLHDYRGAKSPQTLDIPLLPFQHFESIFEFAIFLSFYTSSIVFCRFFFLVQKNSYAFPVIEEDMTKKPLLYFFRVLQFQAKKDGICYNLGMKLKLKKRLEIISHRPTTLMQMTLLLLHLCLLKCRTQIPTKISKICMEYMKRYGRKNQ